ncbi:DUF2142 domain-containing protein [Nocardioides halotolerans]|uniref:DUF2142 domain-containing protein n=1 Tax=Nocardioides halotolerans TaxID=433660 RepID=UPI000429B3FD|nr:DUF2142 domain-containing protein [Nocardioides halotolerans]
MRAGTGSTTGSSAAPSTAPTTGHGWRIAALFLLATLLAQAAWITAVPPFRGMDEFDHAFRAAGVASGQWRLHDVAEGGRGLLVDVPAELVKASEGQCRELAYIVPDTCDGDGPGGRPGTVRATTSAGNYEPVYYWVVGTAGEPFSGAHALYAMRAMAALLCAVVLALAVWCLTTWVRGTWAFVGLLVGLTPTFVYSTTLAAPNGLEMAAGVLLWTALLGLGGRGPVDHGLLRRERWLLGAAALAVVLLAGLRTLGPLWVVLILACVAALRGPGTVLAIALRHRLQVALICVLAVATTGSVLLWNQGKVSVPPGEYSGEIESNIGQVFRWLNWILGSVGAFPFRDQPAPLEVYVLALLVLITMWVAAVRRGAGGGRGSVLLGTVLFFLAPSVIVALTLETHGGMWQGRYALPFTAGLLIMVGLVLDRRGWHPAAHDARPLVLAMAMLAGAAVVSVVHVQRAELDRAVSSDDAAWLHPPTAVTGLVILLAWVVSTWLALALARAGSTAAPTTTRGTDATARV